MFSHREFVNNAVQRSLRTNPTAQRIVETTEAKVVDHTVFFLPWKQGHLGIPVHRIGLNTLSEERVSIISN